MNNGWIIALLLLFLLPGNRAESSVQDTVLKSIYPQSLKNKSPIYNSLWGVHYRMLYATPITADAVTLNTLLGGVQVVDQAPGFHGLILADRRRNLFMLKPLGGSTSFLESKFFREIYNQSEYQGTYMNKFIGDAYTIINPYTFLAADYMAKVSGLYFDHSRIYYMAGGVLGDTIANGSSIRNKLVSIKDVPDTATQKNILTTEELLKKIRLSKSYQVDQRQYITERLYDMLVGDWNKVPENWNWQASATTDSLLFAPIVIDRGHAFTKVDGFLFKRMLDALELGFITNYSKKVKDIEQINTLGYTLDMALAGGSGESVWLQQAHYLQNILTDSVINQAFSLLPSEIQGSETDVIKAVLISRRESLPAMARQYYKRLQRTPVITGTEHDDRIVVERLEPDSLRISIYKKESSVPSFDKKYTKKETEEIWLYGLDGDDQYVVEGQAKEKLPVYLIAGPGNNTYDMQNKSRIRLYDYDAYPSVRNYNYEKVKRREFSFTPWGFYDSDVGFSLGAFFTYTLYGFKQSPFTFRHRIGYNYLNGFIYQGAFPFYDKRKSFNLDAFIASPRNFSNFFGYGNNTEGFKDEAKNYNRVSLRQYSLTPSFRLNVKEEQLLKFAASFEMYKARRPDDRYINEVYSDSLPIFKTNLYAGLEASYQYTKSPAPFISGFEANVSAGWKMNIKDVGRNYPYANTRVLATFKCFERFSIATELDAKLLFSNKYDFYQAASLDLRGFRGNRFIGKQAFYQLTDFMLDMGKLRNPFTPLKYGLFAGFDYGRVWYPGEHSRAWHTSYGGGVWLTVLNKFTTKYSCFGSKDSVRFLFTLGLGF